MTSPTTKIKIMNDRKAEIQEMTRSRNRKPEVTEEMMTDLATKFAAAEIAANVRRRIVEREYCGELFELAGDLLSRMTIMQIKRFTNQVKRKLASESK